MPKKSASRADALPKLLAPQLAVLTSDVPSRGDWLYEVKFDGYRILTRFERASRRSSPAAATTGPTGCRRSRTSWRRSAIDSSWLDGEIVVLNDRGGR